MGFLEAGIPLDWEDSLPFINNVKRDGILQLIHQWALNYKRFTPHESLRWGDEMEFTLVSIDQQKKEAKLCVDAPELLKILHHKEVTNEWDTSLCEMASILSGSRIKHLHGSEWHPEFGNHMIEATPNPPYEMSVNSLLDVEHSMLSRRYKVQSVLPENVYCTSLAAYPHIGLGDYMWSSYQAIDKSPLSAGSSFIRDMMINPHPRFPTLSKNINRRRRRKVSAAMPIYQDLYTSDSAWYSENVGVPVETIYSDRQKVERLSYTTPNPIRDHIYMDHFGFGMGMSCLQVTFGCPDLKMARYLYDQLAVLAPIFLSLSAATPALRGFLADTDTRWRVLEQTCDCRTDDEVRSLDRTRFGAVGAYIGDHEYLNTYEAVLNDVILPCDKDAENLLKRSGIMDDRIIKHFASLWVRDPLVIFSDRIDQDNAKFVDHFENLQSTNWNSVRFKVPPPSSTEETRIPWRVELRTPDLQLSDFANAALACITAVLTMAVLKDNWNLYIPISKTHQNMDEAHQRNSVTDRLFWFRTDIFGANNKSPEEVTARMSLRDIFLGSKRFGFSGLLPLCDDFISQEWRSLRCSRQAVEKYRLYSNYIRSRVLGQARTDAKLLRELVLAHPNYERDSVIGPEINFEMSRFAILSGFGLCPQTSSWGLPGCLPSSLRLATYPSNLDLGALLELPIAKGLANIAAASTFRGRSESLLSDEDDEDDCPIAISEPSTATRSAPTEDHEHTSEVAVNDAVGNGSHSENAFDCVLFLKYEECSR